MPLPPPVRHGSGHRVHREDARVEVGTAAPGGVLVRDTGPGLSVP